MKADGQIGLFYVIDWDQTTSSIKRMKNHLNSKRHQENCVYHSLLSSF